MSARSGNDPSLSDLWREFEEAEAGFSPNPTEAEHDRFQAAQQAIINARPTDPAGIAIQLACLRWLCDGSDPGETAETILAHAVEALTPDGEHLPFMRAGLDDPCDLAAPPAPDAGPLSSTF
jgi:hypothetical protein